MIITSRALMSWSDHDIGENLLLLALSVILVLFAGIMSGLTLGLMSLDMVEMEVLVRSGTARERRCASEIIPVLKHGHVLLVTLLLCNAVAMEALPLFLDELANPITAIIVSVTAVLFFGEIIPQALCAKFGLAIGANCAWFVKALIIVCSPIAWPIGKLLDKLLGHESMTLFRRGQLKALVNLHGQEQGFGGKLTIDETKIIAGALDLTNKIAFKSMTPLERVFMVSTDDVLDEATLRSILASGHSRIPVYHSNNRSDIAGLILVKELIQYTMAHNVPVSSIKMRSLPRLSAATPMYDLLKLFQTGRSHMAVLTQPYPDELPTTNDWAASTPATDSGGFMPAGPALESADELTQPLILGESSGMRGTSWEGHIVPGETFPELAPVGEPIGIITIEDVIEELMQAEILDETDLYVDNEKSVRVPAVMRVQTLPEEIKSKLKARRATNILASFSPTAEAGERYILQFDRSDSPSRALRNHARSERADSPARPRRTNSSISRLDSPARPPRTGEGSTS